MNKNTFLRITKKKKEYMVERPIIVGRDLLNCYTFNDEINHS